MDILPKLLILGEQLLMLENKYLHTMHLKNEDAEDNIHFPIILSIIVKSDLIKVLIYHDYIPIIEHFDEDKNRDLYKLLKLWACDKYGNFLMEEEEDFDLYKARAKNVKSAIPKNPLNKNILSYLVDKNIVVE